MHQQELIRLNPERGMFSLVPPIPWAISFCQPFYLTNDIRLNLHSIEYSIRSNEWSYFQIVLWFHLQNQIKLNSSNQQTLKNPILSHFHPGIIDHSCRYQALNLSFLIIVTVAENRVFRLEIISCSCCEPLILGNFKIMISLINSNISCLLLSWELS